MAFITPKDADEVSKTEEKPKPETEKDVPSESDSKSGDQGEGIERRGSRRHSAKREAHLLFIASPLAAESPGQLRKLIGYTRDISETGLSLIVTPTHASDYDLCEIGNLLRVKLSLPLGVVEMDTKVVRCERLDEHDPGRSNFVGVSITEVSEENRSRYNVYLTTLG